MLMLLVLGGENAGPKSVGGVVVCLLLLPLFGAPNSLAFLPPLSTMARVCRRRPLARWRRVVAAVRRCGVLFVRALLRRSANDRHTADTKPQQPFDDSNSIAKHGAGTGSPRRVGLPRRGRRSRLAGATGIGLLRAWRERPRERLGTLGLLLFLSGFVVLALGVGWGRAGLDGTAGLRNRYVTLSAPLICAVYCAWGQCMSARRCRLAQVFLFAALAGLVVPNTLDGIQRSRGGQELLAAVERDARLRGMTPSEMAHMHTRLPQQLLWSEPMESELAAALDCLRQDRLGPFKGVD